MSKRISRETNREEHAEYCMFENPEECPVWQHLHPLTEKGR